jgi:arogenate dehydrogenase (NADP+)
MQIGIVGLGSIGASLAGDWRALGHEIIGVSRQQVTCDRAIERGLVDRASIELGILAGADIIIICTPIDKILPTVAGLVPHLSPDTVVTDAGSVKEAIVAAATALCPNFVGGHPMAGTANSGIDAALRGLFAHKPYIITPLDNTVPTASDRVVDLVRSLDCQIHYASPSQHDRAVAWISHLPVMVSSSLIAACTSETDPEILQLAKHLASSGFRDTSRVGGGNPELGMMMARYNRDALLASLTGYRHQLDRVISAIESEDWQEITNLLTATQIDRPAFLK